MNPKLTRFLIFLAGSAIFSAMASWMVNSTAETNPCLERCNRGDDACMAALDLDGAHPVGAPGERTGECAGVCSVIGRTQRELVLEAEMEGEPAPPLHACLEPLD